MATTSQQTSSSQTAGFFSNLFGQKTSTDEPSASVLDEWNRYASESEGPSQANNLLSQVEEGSASMQRYLSSSLNRVATNVQGVSGSMNSQISSFQMPTSTQLAYVTFFLGGGLFFLALAFSVFLPVIIIAPSKFAICFTIGSLMILSGFIYLRGWRSQLSHMFSSNRLFFTAVYLGSMIGTLYAAMGMHSYVLSLVFCSVQIVSLLYYTLSYFPGGIYGLKYLMYSLKSAVMQCFLAVVTKR